MHKSALHAGIVWSMQSDALGRGPAAKRRSASGEEAVELNRRPAQGLDDGAGLGRVLREVSVLARRADALAMRSPDFPAHEAGAVMEALTGVRRDHLRAYELGPERAGAVHFAKSIVVLSSMLGRGMGLRSAWPACPLRLHRGALATAPAGPLHGLRAPFATAPAGPPEGPILRPFCPRIRAAFPSVHQDFRAGTPATGVRPCTA